MSKKLVLIIEDEATLRRSFVRGLGKVPGVQAVGFGSLDEALIALDHNGAALVLCDPQLPGRSGLELLDELEHRKLELPIIFLSANPRAYEGRIPRTENIDLLEKPVALKALRTLVGTRLRADDDAKETSSSSLSVIGEHVQLACLSGHSIEIEVTSPGSNKPRGWIIVHVGRLWSARDAKGQGEGAFLRLISLSKCDVRCRPLATKPGDRKILSSWQMLILNAARSIEGRTQPSREAEAAERKLGRDAEAEFHRLVDEGMEALLCKDYALALQCLEGALELQPGNVSIETKIERLKEIGV